MTESKGGCLCGAIRYRLAEAPQAVAYCHCRNCQRASGAPVLVFGTVPRDAFVVEQGNPRRHRSSPIGERWFCGDCGCQIAMHVDYQIDTIDIAIATLDVPEASPPEFHIWHGSRIGWFETADHLTRYPDAGPDGSV
ncbi:GFA family protein [Flavisphingomonas formosensis]|uniref:GFA family protein n=1 Tax=Flavisphingomonas formosensis TaxID=861534 RepID=UPI0012F92E7A|nr:GFA family protein [Sphingomonas formosensis]